MAKIPLESNACTKRSTAKGSRLTPSWSGGKTASPWMDRIILPILGPHHDDRHFQKRTLAPEAPIREHHHAAMSMVMVAKLERARKDCKSTTKILTSLQQKQRRQNSFVFLRTREYRKDHRSSIASRTGMAEPKLENLMVANFLCIILTTLVATRTSRLSVARTPRHSVARSQFVDRVMATYSFKAT